LLLAANPKDTNKLRLDEEVREIQAALKRARNREQFESSPNGQYELATYAAVRPPPTGIFSGHGSGSTGLGFGE